MGALATDFWTNSAGVGNGGASVFPANNPIYKPVSVSYSTTSTASAVKTALSSASRAVTSNKVTTAINLVTTAYEAVSSLISTLNEADRITAQNDLDALASQKKQLELQKEAGQMTQQKQDELQDYLTRQQDAVSANAGTNLLSVLTNNGKSLVTSIGTITSTFGEKFDTLNECMYSFLKYMDTVTTVMQQSYDLSKSNSDQAKKDKEATIEVGDTKMSPQDIEVQKNLAMMKTFQFKTSPIDQSVLEADQVTGMTPLQIEASHRSFEVEAKVYAKTPTQVKDIDENVLFDMAPREASLVKNAVTAINQTDEKNFELDDDDLDIVSPFDISSIFGYEKSSDIIAEYVKKMQGITSA